MGPDQEELDHRAHVNRLSSRELSQLAYDLREIQDIIQRLRVADPHLSQGMWVNFNRLQDKVKALL